nr:ribonuclease H-like domain-containing protein [Tanacetum cinerariifolium]
MSLSEYYPECNALWRQFDSLVDLTACSCDTALKVKKHIQLLRNSHNASKHVKTGSIAFAARPNNNNWTSNRNNNNSNNRNGNRRFGRVSNLVCKHCNMTGHIIDRCFELAGFHLGLKGLMVKQIGSYKLSKSLLIKDVLVVPDYHFLMRTGSEKGGLYFLDEDFGHPSDQVLTVLRNKIKGFPKSSPEPCEICHKVKQTKEAFPIIDHKTSGLGELVHLDVWGPYKVTSREGFRLPTAVLYGKSPYECVYKGYKPFNLEQKKIVLSRDVKFPFKNISITKEFVFEEIGINDLNFLMKFLKAVIGDVAREQDTLPYENIETTRPFGSSSSRKDTSSKNYEGEDIEPFGHMFDSTEPAVEQTIRRLSRKFTLPSKYSGFVLKKTKYGIDKVVNYSNLSVGNFVFATNLNKIHEPSTYEEAVKDN